MSQDLRLYSLSLIVMLMLWIAPVHAELGYGTDCATLAIPIGYEEWNFYTTHDREINDSRILYPDSETDLHAISENDSRRCSLYVGNGNYYDGANHLWILDDNLTCDFNDEHQGDFWAGNY